MTLPKPCLTGNASPDWQSPGSQICAQKARNNSKHCLRSKLNKSLFDLKKIYTEQPEIIKNITLHQAKQIISDSLKPHEKFLREKRWPTFSDCKSQVRLCIAWQETIQQTLNLRYKQTIHSNWLQVSLMRFQLQAAYCWYNSASESLKEDQSFWLKLTSETS